MKICHFNNTCEKIQRYCIPCGKDSKRYHKSFTKAGKVVFTIANDCTYIVRRLVLHSYFNMA